MNSYAVVDEVAGPYVLVDPGMYWLEGLTALGRQLTGAGLRLCDAQAIIITHFHVDHATAAPALASLCPLPVYMGEKDLRAVEEGFESYFNGVLELYRQYGVPSGETDAMGKVHPVPRLAKAYDELASLDLRPLREGDEVRVGASLVKVIEVPGHTPGHVALLVNGMSEAVVGDALLNDITPHVVLDRADRDALGEHMRTLKRFQEMGLGVARPGHRDDVNMPAERAAQIIAHHEERLQEVRSLISAEGATLYEVARKVRWRTRARSWSDMSPYERYFAIGEALAHLKRLVNLGLADEVVRGGEVVFIGDRP
ncbi:MAG: MBL fold metallo-hydrolase [Acidilobus sp.]